MRAKKLPSGNWRCLVYVGRDSEGKRKYRSFTAESKKEAEFKASQHLTNRKENESKLTVGETVEQYILSHKDVTSPATIAGWRKDQRNYTVEAENVPLADFDTKEAQIFINKLVARGLSPKTIANAYGLITAAIRYEDPDKALSPTLPTKIPPKLYIPTEAEVKLLIEEAREELSLAIILASVGTMRRGEICGLEYEDIKGNFIHVQRDIVKDENKVWITKQIPKTSESERWIELPAVIIDRIGTGTGRIFTANPDQISGRFCRLRNRLQIPCRFHDLRHFAVSIMHAIGVPDQYIMARAGFKTDYVLKQTYRNVLEDKQNEFTSMTNARLTETIL